jgi:hypothetical protein
LPEKCLELGGLNGWDVLDFLIALILWNNSSQLRKSFECGIPRPTRTQASRCRNTFTFTTVICYPIRQYNAIAVLVMSPCTQGYRKDNCAVETNCDVTLSAFPLVLRRVTEKIIVLLRRIVTSHFPLSTQCSQFRHREKNNN